MQQVRVREAASIEDLLALNSVFEAVWGPASQAPVNVARAIQHSGGYAALAEQGDRLVGASLGFIGRHAGELVLHSHITATTPDAVGRGIGYDLKQHQKQWCLDREIEVITWTFDPLVRRNAYFNLTKLGAEATEFHPNFYGAMNDDVNGGDDTDRVLARWRLTVERQVDPRPRDGVVVLEIGSGRRPVVLESRSSTLLVRIPEDFHALRRSDPAAGAAWRGAVRATLGEAIDHGYVATAMTTDGCYVLQRM